MNLDQLAAFGFRLLLRLFALLVVVARLQGLDDIDAHFAEHGEDILDLLGIDLLGGQYRVDLVLGDIAPLLGGVDESLDRRV